MSETNFYASDSDAGKQAKRSFYASDSDAGKQRQSVSELERVKSF